MKPLKRNSILILMTSLMTMNPSPKTSAQNLDPQWQTDTSQRLVDLDEFKTMLKRDQIPPIDDPVFWNLNKAKDEFHEHEPVIVVENGDQAKAYPVSILIHHEIVNDKVDGKPLTITYCPLCNAGMVFERELTYEGKTYLLDFGVSGMLRKSDLVMWDRQTESWWQQISGKALVGKLAGAELNLYPSSMLAFEDFEANHPDGKVLATETGEIRDYGTNPYVGYDENENEQPRFIEESVNSPLPPKERIVTIKGQNQSKAYPYSVIREQEVLNDSHEGKKIVIFFKGNTLSPLDEKQIAKSRKIGSATVHSRELGDRVLTFEKAEAGIKDQQTGSIWNIRGQCVEGPLEGEELPPVIHGDHFAFAWFAFHENTKVYKTQQ